ncbi:autotransporter adhesin BigA [Salmonella enterica subsp. enterica]|uniref:BigA/YdbA N-terminal beta-barrel domain-containing protein n=1 Tax=Salmonella enterica TaxID=28901 RepID=UPI0012799117|nr:autotransporter adhesin BigA [Salmonella enterica]ECU8280013.1 autotransporter domain-containing protein [Salmonella enterica subsp. enterica serovar O rough]EAV9352494.1 autotransporter domain-containing protein [Salmonella enterica]EBV1445266.1 autotransporter adhesin BigA [Salmonella enterica subsp. enterica serovar Mississippi]ECG3049947.1 autotransporter domain-containing protein [Salmonella enterica subsp. enterica serovar Mississippi]EDS3216461.1 autotransporter domain-containing pro
MQKKKLISIAIALTLQSYYIPAIAAENNDDEKECPSNISSLPKEKRAKLSPTCLATPENDNHWGWVAGGVAALVAGVAIGVENNGGGDSTHSYTPPTHDNGGDVTPPDDGGNVTPPDDGGDDNVIPPDDSGDDDVTPPDDSSDDDVTPPDDSGDDDVTPPDDSGDDDVTPPDDSGDDDVTPPDDSGDDDVTPPDDSGDDDVTPPDDSGDDDVTPPDDSGDDDVTPPDDSGDDDVTPPDDSGDDDVTPPDDSGDDDDTPPDDSVITFSNGVTIDKGKDTLTFDSFKLDNGSVLEGAVWNYSEQNNQWQLTTLDGKTLNVTGWDVTDANAAVIEGTQENGLYWKYDSRGYLIIADDKTTVITGDDQAHTSDRGMDISGQDRTGVIISGDRTVNTLTGGSSVTDGAIGMVITGDGTTNTISGHSTVDNATGALISGNGTTTNFAGDIAVSGGGTAIIIDGDNATIKNTGTSTINGTGSTGTVIDGNNARVNNDGDMTITDGGTGAHITGDNAVIDNAGDTTVSGTGSTALYIDGDNALIINEGNQTISGGAIGTRIDGNDARIANTGDIAVDGAGSAAAIINGDNSSLTQAGDLLVTGGAMGIITYGTGNEAKNTGNATVRDADSVGFVVAGEQNTFKNKGNINISLNGTGALVSGNASQATLDGDINVTATEDGDNVYRGATGLDMTGNNNTLNIIGSVTVNGDYDKDSVMAGSSDTLMGMSISGSNNAVDLSGTLNINVSDMSNVDEQYLNTVGLDVAGDGNTVDLAGGININYTEDADGLESALTGINISGDSSVTLSGESTLNIATVPGGAVTLANVRNGGNLTLDQNSTVNINETVILSNYYMTQALLTASGEGSSINNQGTVVDDGAVALLLADSGAQAQNSGKITAYATTGTSSRNAIAAANGQGSTVNNEAEGTITLVSSLTPFSNTGAGNFPLIWYKNTLYAMLAEDYGEVSNDAGATIYLQGAGVYGVSASKGTALNAGDIYLDGFVPTLDDENNITDKTYWTPPKLYVTSAAMVAGTTDSGYGDATATNTGTINVNNAGFGMMALDGGTAINQGVITLTADEGVTGQANELVGMAALNGGVVINDTTGTINIDADYGQPFLTDSKSTVVNYGTVCYDSACQNSDEYNPTDSNVSLSFRDGDEITAEGETLTGETITTNPVATETVHVSNAGTVSGGKVIIKNYGDVTNESTGSISSVSIETGGIYTNDGTTAAVSVDGGVFNNTGTVTGKTGTTVAGSVINNSGSMNTVEQWASTINNTGTVTAWTGASGSAVLNNNTGGEVDKLTFTAAATVNNAGVIKNGSVDKSGTLNNLEDGVMTLADNGLWSGTFNNWGTVNSDADIATGGNGHTLYNGSTGVINGQITTSKNNGGSKAINDGTINIDKTNNVAMSAHGSAKMVNNGTINVGTVGTTQTGMVGMQLESDAKSDAVIENNGTINIYASNSYAFSQLGSNGHIVNNGTVYIDDSVTGSGFIKQDGKTIEGSGENGDGTEVHYVDFIAPTEPTINDGMTTVTTSDSAGSSTTNNLSGYVVGTSADGSAGKLKVSNASMNGVEINTGFAAGTADTTVNFDNVVEGSNLSDAGAIQSTSVVWNAQGSQDADGNVDVTMTKNAYADVATDSSVSDVAQALDASYTNNELYTSLNVGTTAELNSALKQVSGAQATTVFREARVLSNRFTMLADAAPQIKDGLAFNVVAKGDPRAELGNDTQYDMLALRQTLDLTASQNLTLEYGIARLDGDGSKTAGDNGLTGGYSQFFGLKHSMAFDEGLAWNNSLRYDVHNLDSSRSVAYGDVNKIADSDMRQQYLEFRSEGAKTFTMMSDTLKVTPYAGVKFRHTMEDGYKERSAGDFNLSMNSGNETAVDSIVGLKLDYAGKDGWSATATLEGGPNLSYSKSQRTASLQGAAGQSFGVDDGQKGGGVNGLATIGVKYSSNDTALHLDAYQWKEDGISDKGFMLNVKKTFR